MCDNVHIEVYTVNDDFMQVTQMVSLSGSQISDIMLFITEFGDLACATPNLLGQPGRGKVWPRSPCCN